MIEKRTGKKGSASFHMWEQVQALAFLPHWQYKTRKWKGGQEGILYENTDL